MPSNYLVTGSRGGSTPHVTSQQARNYNAGVVGGGNYVMSGLGASMTSANTLHVSAGVASFQGADVEVPSGGADLTIENGSQGMLRSDLVVLRYEADAGVESVSLVVIQGTPAGSDPEDPAYNEGSISDGSSPVDFPLYRVPLNGITVGEPEALFSTIPSIDSLRDSVSQGELIVPANPGDTSSVRVSFPRPMRSVPTVMLTIVSAAPDRFYPPCAENIDEEGFTLYVQRSTNNNTRVAWLAVCP